MLEGTGIHSLNNVCTLDPSVHDLFISLFIWFEPLVSDVVLDNIIVEIEDDIVIVLRLKVNHQILTLLELSMNSTSCAVMLMLSL